MNTKTKDGIIMGQSFYLKEDKRIGFPYYIRLLQLLIILAGGWSWVFILTECFIIPVNTTYINLAIIMIGVVFYLLFLFPRFDIIKIIISCLLYGFEFYYRFPRLQNSFYIMENLVLDRVEDYYGYTTYRFLADYETQARDLTWLMIMLLIPVIALLTAAILRNRWINLCNLILFVPIAASFAFGRIPSEIYLITSLLVILYLTRAYLSGHPTNNKELMTLLQRVNSRAAIWLCGGCLLLFALIRLFYPPQHYEGVTQIQEAKTKLQTFLYEFSIEDFTKGFIKLSQKGVATGGLEGGELGGASRIEFDQTTHLRVIAPASSVTEGLYLKGYVGSEYTGHSWKDHNPEMDINYLALTKSMDSETFVPLDQSIRLMNTIFDFRLMSEYQFSYNQGRLWVIYEGANPKFAYTPYYTDYRISNQLDYYQDLYVTPVNYNDQSYEFSYYFNISDEEGSPLINNPDFRDLKWSFNKNEKLYRDFVYETYTKLPEKGLERLKEYMLSLRQEVSGYDTMEVIKHIKDYLHKETSYSLAPGGLPKDQDFVEYFLFDNKLGYCAHYASSAALMLRALGIPTRYVEGYAAGIENINSEADVVDERVTTYSNEGVSSQDSTMVELLVLDSDAHAWVEVYVDYIGWVPIEFTPAAGIENTTAATQNLTITGEENEEETTPTPTPTITPMPTATPTIIPTTPPVQDTEDHNQPEGSKDDLGVKGLFLEQMKHILIGVLIITLPIVILLVTFAFVKAMKKHRLSRANRSSKALLIYQEMERLLKASRSLPRGRQLQDFENYVAQQCPYLEKNRFDECMEMIKKARFSNKELNHQEYRQVTSFYHDLYQRVYSNVGLLGKIYLRLILI